MLNYSSPLVNLANVKHEVTPFFIYKIYCQFFSPQSGLTCLDTHILTPLTLKCMKNKETVKNGELLAKN